MLLLVIAIPAIELAVIISVGGAIGVWPTVLCIFLTAIIGLSLIRPQGRQLMMRMKERMDQGEPPTEETFHGVCLALAGICLLVPGFISDAIGFLLLLPFLRTWLFQRYQRQSDTIRHRASAPGASGPTIVEGKFEPIEEEDDQTSADTNPQQSSKPPRKGGWG